MELVLANRPFHLAGKRLENQGLHTFGSRASGGIDGVVTTAKQTRRTGPRRVRRGPYRFA